MDVSKPENNGGIISCVIALTVLAPVFGGANKLWWQAGLCICTGVLFLFSPPRQFLGLVPLFSVGGLLILALAGFLPAHIFPTPPWRSELVRVGLLLPDTISPQPWLTLEAFFSLLLGLSWGYYVLALEWNANTRQWAWWSIAAMTVVLAGGLTVSFLLKQRIPFWPDVPEFGFFPNRNHSSNVLALGGILIYAIGMQRLNEGRRTWWAWLVCLALVCSALILNYSRAGIILLFAGMLAWHTYWVIGATDKRLAVRTSAALVFFIAILLLIGGAVLARFQPGSDELFGTHGGRIAIYRDAFALLLKSPVTGIGLNNFGALFATAQKVSAGPDIAIHPESDWLWSAVTLGWFAPLLIAVLFGWLVWRCFPFDPGTFRLLRAAALTSCCGFVVHALFDVPGHHLAAIWPILLLAATALHPRRRFESSAVVPWILRILGGVFIGIGGCWFASIQGADIFPTSATLSRIREQISQSIDHQDYEKSRHLATEGLKIAPLDWELYFKRGFAESAFYQRSEMLRDFAIARHLLPNWPDLYLKEGQVWLGIGEPDYAFDIWREGMSDLGAEVPSFYGDVYPAVKSDAELRDRWRELGRGRNDCVLIFLQNATPTEFQVELTRLLSADPELRTFTPAQLKRLFDLWYQHGEKLSLAETLRAHPEWQEIGWRQLAQVYAEYQDYRQAYETVKRFIPAPAIEIPPNESVESLGSRFRVTNSDRDGLMLALAEGKADQVDDALAVLTVLKSHPRPPPLLYYIEGDLFARKGDWPKAWQAIWTYAEQARPRNG